MIVAEIVHCIWTCGVAIRDCAVAAGISRCKRHRRGKSARCFESQVFGVGPQLGYIIPMGGLPG